MNVYRNKKAGTFTVGDSVTTVMTGSQEFVIKLFEKCSDNTVTAVLRRKENIYIIDDVRIAASALRKIEG